MKKFRKAAGVDVEETGGDGSGCANDDKLLLIMIFWIASGGRFDCLLALDVANLLVCEYFYLCRMIFS